MANFQLVITGTDAAEQARELEAQIAVVALAAVADLRAVRQQASTDATRTGGLELATFVMSIPAAVLAVMDIAARVQLADKLKRVLAWAKGKSIQVRLPDGREQPLAEMDPGEWIDIAVELREASKRELKG